MSTIPPPSWHCSVPSAEASAILAGAVLRWKEEDLVEHPCFYFPGGGAAAKFPLAAFGREFTLSLWFRLDEAGVIAGREATELAGNGQFTLGIRNNDYSDLAVLAFADGSVLEADGLRFGHDWNHLTASCDGRTARLRHNGRPVAVREAGRLAALPGGVANWVLGGGGFTGCIAEFTLWDRALGDAAAAACFEEGKTGFPLPPEDAPVFSEYETGLNEALDSPLDLWGEAVIAAGGATYARVKNLLRPLAISTGATNRDYAPCQVVLALEDAPRPLLVASGVGSDLCIDVYGGSNRLEFRTDGEAWGGDAERTGEAHWEEGWLPVLHTSWTDRSGGVWRQELAARLPEAGGGELAAIGRFIAPAAGTRLTIRLPGDGQTRFRASAGTPEEDGWGWSPEAAGDTLTYLFTAHAPPEAGFAMTAERYARSKAEWLDYWRGRIGGVYRVPEPLVMDCQRNLLYQNLVLRWRYSVGTAVYSDSFFQPESSDALISLLTYGYVSEARQGLGELLAMSKGAGMYTNWECGEKLSYAAEYHAYTGDDGFILGHAELLAGILDDFARQIAAGPDGLLERQCCCGDIPKPSHYLHHQVLCQCGMRVMIELFERLGRPECGRWREAALRHGAALRRLLAARSRELPDGSLFIPLDLDLQGPSEAFEPITATRLGSYWNLVAPYAFASGYWHGEELAKIAGYMRRHGAFFLGMLRFNYYPTRTGASRRDGLPGYYTAGVDNVYLPAWLRVAAMLDEPELLRLSFYGYLAHGQTRGTFISGEGDTLGAYPGHYGRSTYGSFNNSNNTAFLMALRLLLLHEGCGRDGRPELLRFTPAIPPEWLEAGKEIAFDRVPTLFGPVSCRIRSLVDPSRIEAEFTLPEDRGPRRCQWRLPLAAGCRIAGILPAGIPWEGDTVDLTGQTGAVRLEVRLDGNGL